MCAAPKTIGFDADDTLWQNESFFRLTQDRFTDMLRDHAEPDHLSERLLASERRNIGHYGYGVKGFTLSMIETAIEVTDARVPASVIAEIVDIGRDMLAHPIELLPGVGEVIPDLAADKTLILITKGDLLHQERKLAQSGLGDFFQGVEIVSEKNPDIYRSAFAKHQTDPEDAVMVGNSLKSDILPALAVGAWGIHVPHDLTWELEAAPEPKDHRRYRSIPSIDALPDCLGDLVDR